MAVPFAQKVKLGATATVAVGGVRDNVSGDYATDENTSDALGQVLDANRAALSPPITFVPAYLADTQGDWQGTLTAANTAALTDGASYWVRVSITFSSGVVGMFFLPIIVDNRY